MNINPSQSSSSPVFSANTTQPGTYVPQTGVNYLPYGDVGQQLSSFWPTTYPPVWPTATFATPLQRSAYSPALPLDPTSVYQMPSPFQGASFFQNPSGECPSGQCPLLTRRFY